jgi:hypothetical protein
MSTPNSILPPQVPPIDRTATGAAGVSFQAGVNASIAIGEITHQWPGGFYPIL